MYIEYDINGTILSISRNDNKIYSFDKFNEEIYIGDQKQFIDKEIARDFFIETGYKIKESYINSYLKKYYIEWCQEMDYNPSFN